MKDNTFQRRREIEYMLLSGKKLTTTELMKIYHVGRKAIRRDFDIIGEELPVVTRQGYDGGLILSRLVDTFFSRVLYSMLLLPENHSIAVV